MSGRMPCNACGLRDAEQIQVQPGVRIAAADLDARFDVRTVLCRHCGLIYTAPQPAPELLACFYARQHRELFAGGDAPRIPGQGSRIDQRSWLEARLGSLRGWRVLEIGCYDGYLLRLLAERGARAIGAEPCERAAATGRERWGIDIRSAGYEALDFPPGSFDLVVLSHVAEHLRDPAHALRFCHRVLRPGGALFVEVPNALAPRAEHVVDFFTFDHLYNFSPRTLSRLGERCGFRCTAVDADFPFPAFRYLAAAAAPGDAPAPGAPDPVAVEESRRTARDYARRRRRFVAALRDRVAERVARWRARGTRVAIYGAGDHTEHLLALTDLGAAPVVGIVDGDPAKWGGALGGYRVHAPRELAALRAGAVVISSYDFQDEMTASVRELCAPPPEILTLYERTPAFSSFRRAAPSRADAGPPP